MFRLFSVSPNGAQVVDGTWLRTGMDSGRALIAHQPRPSDHKATDDRDGLHPAQWRAQERQEGGK